MVMCWVDRLESVASDASVHSSSRLLTHTYINTGQLSILLAEEVSEVGNSVLGVPDEKVLGLLTVVLVAVYIG
jgi:hypothetical protein